MTMSNSTAVDESRRATIKSIVCEILELEPDEMTDTSLFKEDHGADSMSAIDILAMLERTFNVEIDQAEMARMVNLTGVIAVVDEAPAVQ